MSILREHRDRLEAEQEALILEALAYSEALDNPPFDEIELGANLETATNRTFILDRHFSEHYFRARRWFNNEVLHGRKILRLEERIRRLC